MWLLWTDYKLFLCGYHLGSYLYLWNIWALWIQFITNFHILRYNFEQSASRQARLTLHWKPFDMCVCVHDVSWMSFIWKLVIVTWLLWLHICGFDLLQVQWSWPQYERFIYVLSVKCTSTMLPTWHQRCRAYQIWKFHFITLCLSLWLSVVRDTENHHYICCGVFCAKLGTFRIIFFACICTDRIFSIIIHVTFVHEFAQIVQTQQATRL